MAALCYEMATGRKPLGAFPPPSRLNPGLSPEADAAIRRGLSEDPDDRFPTIGEFGEALERGLSGGPGPRPDRPVRRLALVGPPSAALVAVGLRRPGRPLPRGVGPRARPPPRV